MHIIRQLKCCFLPCMHANLLLGTPNPKYEPFITHNRGHFCSHISALPLSLLRSIHQVAAVVLHFLCQVDPMSWSRHFPSSVGLLGWNIWVDNNGGITRHDILSKTCIASMHCKSLWIKSSAKCINVKCNNNYIIAYPVTHYKPMDDHVC